MRCSPSSIILPDSSPLYYLAPTKQVLASHQKEFKQIYPRQGWHEQDPEEIFESCLECINTAVERLEKETEYKKEDVKGFGITNQRETTVVWDKKTGQKLYNAVAWPDTRNTSTVKALAKKTEKGLDALKEKVRLYTRDRSVPTGTLCEPRAI